MYKKLDIIEHAILLNPKYIKIFRNKLKITQSKLAEESGVSQSHLSMLEKGKREATKSHAAAITLGLLKCSDIWDKENPILYLLDILSLTKLESTIVKLVKELLSKNSTHKRYIEGYPVFIVDRDSFTEYIKKNLKVITIENVEFFRGRIKVKGIYSDNRDVCIFLDCSDIRRLETKISKVLGKKQLSRYFQKKRCHQFTPLKKMVL
ncbi:helix-turn-helix domain protein [Methanothermococcus okinawensis IH1]|uniref:Helix-turn-helix domain protein n=1 Tax=Methanothermococcus okinawensis (strain DSM 14208 / JCM 11175 / IH1) TaxID=647113 RepID=F8ANF6_METOI|nr:helix-turn-helix domain protein [Methanothermococcus okinawensis IH1]